MIINLKHPHDLHTSNDLVSDAMVDDKSVSVVKVAVAGVSRYCPSSLVSHLVMSVPKVRFCRAQEAWGQR